MKKIICSTVAVLFLAGGTVAFAAPTDIVPRGDIAYDLLSSLAAAGQLPGYTVRDFGRGDLLYTRAEMAAIVRGISTADNESFAASVRLLRSEFAPELNDTRGVPASGGVLTGQVKARVLTGPGAAAGTLRVGAVLPIGRDGYAAVSAGEYRDEWYDDSRARRGYPTIETAFLRVNGRALDVSVGKRPMRWGAGYSGALLLSDESASVPQIRVEKKFRLPGRFGRSVGDLYFEQFSGQFFEGDVPFLDAATPAPANTRGTRRYLQGRRFATQGAGRWTLSLSESFKSTRLPDPIQANLLPFYLYQNDWSKGSTRYVLKWLVNDRQENTAWLNYIADAGVSYRANGATVYGDFLLDDIRAPEVLSAGNETPRKIGLLVGVHAPDLGRLGNKYGLRLEYASIDRQTYDSSSPAVGWTQNDLPLGYPTGANASVLFGRFDAVVSPKVKVAAEGAVRRRRDSSLVNGTDTDRVGLFATYALRQNAYLGARFEHLTVKGNAGAGDTNRNRFELNAGFGF